MLNRRPANEATTPSVDDRVLESFTRDHRGREALRDIIGLFADHIPGRIAALRAALESGDRVHATRLAHSIRGGAGITGAARLAWLAEQLEDRLADNDSALPTVREVESLFTEFDHVRELLAVRLVG